MSEENRTLAGPDLTKGIPIADLIVLARNGGALFAIGAECTHYRALSDGVLVADTVRCPWRHACFAGASSSSHARLCKTGDVLNFGA